MRFFIIAGLMITGCSQAVPTPNVAPPPSPKIQLAPAPQPTNKLQTPNKDLISTAVKLYQEEKYDASIVLFNQALANGNLNNGEYITIYWGLGTAYAVTNSKANAVLFLTKFVEFAKEHGEPALKTLIVVAEDAIKALENE